MKKKSRKNYPAFDPALNPRTRWELITDYDYLDKLSPEEKEWLHTFTKEYVHADFDNDKRIHPKRVKKKSFKNGKVRKVDEYKNDAETRNNTRNRCVSTISTASRTLGYLEELQDKLGVEYEDQLIEKLDNLNNSSSEASKKRKNPNKL